jgi:AraC family transcriptional regulator
MPLVDFSAGLGTSTFVTGTSHVVSAKEVTAFIGTTPCYSSEYTMYPMDHYLLSLPITPRPRGAWARYEATNERVAMGEVMLFPPGFVQHGSLLPWTGVRKDICCIFPKSSFEKLMPGAVEWSEPNLCETVNLRNANIRLAIQRLGHEAVSPGLASAIVMDSLASLIAIDLQRHFWRGRMPSGAPSHTLEKHAIDTIDEFIHAHIFEEIYLHDLADLCGLSVRHFSRMFKLTTGVTVANYVAGKRLAVAQDMLRDTKMPIKLVASRVGFSNVSNFTTAFKRMSGVTPSTFRGQAV